MFYIGKLDDFEKLRPEELNQQNIEVLIAESNLVCTQDFPFIDSMRHSPSWNFVGM